MNETSSLKDDKTSVRQQIALDVAKRLKDQLEQFVTGKPLTNNPNQRLWNNHLRELLIMGVSGQSLVGTVVKKLFRAGWFQGTITKCYPWRIYITSTTLIVMGKIAVIRTCINT